MANEANRALKTDNLYLHRYAHPEQLIQVPPSSNLGLVVAIPCFNEPDLTSSLAALSECEPPNADVEVIILINQPTNCDTQISQNNQRTKKEFHHWIQNNQRDWIRFHLVMVDIPQRQAGVGSARKMAMDEAVRRLIWAGQDEYGVIIGFDADCLCDQNYLRAIEDHFNANPQFDGCSIYFEHPLQGPLTDQIYRGILRYELHLRCLINGMKFSGLPFAFQTLGSSMAVRSRVYQSQGGMNRRKAGEDFHFLQKIIALGSHSNLTTTRVTPSPRISDRVPFGTGKAMYDWINSEMSAMDTYNPRIFEDLKTLVDLVPSLFTAGEAQITAVLNQLTPPLGEHLTKLKFNEILEEINRQSSSRKTFVNRFYRWFNALRAIKVIHHLRDNAYPNVEVSLAAKSLLSRLGVSHSTRTNIRQLLTKFREIDRGLT